MAELNPIPKDKEEVKVQAGKARVVQTEALPDKVHTWPYLVRAEFISGCVLMLVLMIWSITVDAPMEDPSNPTKTPNPSKAPWYFLGLQEMLVYFDPWIAGVILPSLIIVGLMVIPYVDTNPRGNGYYTIKERPFAIFNFLFGFLFMWCGMITIGVFFRGPGWNLYWPWSFWDPHKVVALTNVDWGYKIGQITNVDFFKTYNGGMVVGAATLGAYFGLIPIFWKYAEKKKLQSILELGILRYNLVGFLFLAQFGVIIKMILRLTLNIKYILVTPYLNI